jgi:phosphotransferase system enzyme I (PtsI)
VVEKLKPREVVIRVLDLGSDKELSYLPMVKESNPALGERGIRFLLNHPDIFRTQLRAILRVNSLYPLGILLPMITDVEEIVQTKSILNKEMISLKYKGFPFDHPLKFGVMIEVPSAALQIERISQEVDFFSIGTNDLIQYTLASDRLNHDTQNKYEELHPSILYMLKLIVESAKRLNKDVSICGDMAGNNRLTKLLLGIGFKIFSVSTGEYLEIKKAVLETDLRDAAVFADHALQLGTTEEIKSFLEI